MLKDPTGIGHVSEPYKVEPDLACLLKALQFDPGVPVYRATPDREFADFMESIQSELFAPGVTAPRGLVFKRRDRRLGGWGLEVAIELLKVLRKPYHITPEGPIPMDLSGLANPDWYFRGLICDGPAFGPYKFVGRVHTYIPTDNLGVAHGWPEGMVIQVVTEPSNADPDTPLMWGIGLPGDPPA